MKFEPPTIVMRGQVARAVAAVQAHKPAHGETAGRISCPRCGATLIFNIQSNGISRGSCAAACGVRWQQ